MKADQAERVQTRPVDARSGKFRDWYNAQRESSMAFIATHERFREESGNVAHVQHAMMAQGSSPIPPPTQPKSKSPAGSPADPPAAAPSPAPPLGFHAYINGRQGVDWNTCGQAAIGTILDYYGRDPFRLARGTGPGNDGRMHWDDGAIIDAISQGGWGPDVIFGIGTTGGRISDAIRYYGLQQAYVEHSGLFSAGWTELWDKLRYFLRVLHAPVPVLIDLGAFGKKYWYEAHWPIAYSIGPANEVYLASSPVSPVDEDTFLHAWHCNFLPLGFNHCAVFYQPAWG
jgi:hypothetical protein